MSARTKAPVWREKRGGFPAYLPSYSCRTRGWLLTVSESRDIGLFVGNGKWSFFAEKGDARYNSAWERADGKTYVYRSLEAAQRAALAYVHQEETAP